jgi:hypothetical protein
MTRVKQSKKDLELQLRQQISFLISSCQAYDVGKYHEAKRIASIIRTLFHRTKTCKPLIGQLQLNSINWIDTAQPYDPKNLVSHLGLTGFKMMSGRLPSIIPKGALPKESEGKKYNTLEFNQWWTKPVVVALGGNEKRYFSRQNLVLNVAETDGGAHVDEGLEEIYNELSRKNGLGVYAIVNGNKYPLLYPELPCLRQIGHEVLITLKKNLSHLFDETYEDEITIVHSGEIIENLQTNVGLEIYIRKGTA